MSEFNKIIEDLEKKIDIHKNGIISLENEISKINSLRELYPDLKVCIGRWGKTVYCSKSVNHLVNLCERRYNCGCCEDSPLEFWPYLKTEFGNVYSDPAYFYLAEKNRIYEATPYENWEDKLKKANISIEVIDFIRSTFEIFKEKRIRYAAEDSVSEDEIEPL